MKITEWKNPSLIYMALLVCWLMLTPTSIFATDSKAEQAPGRSMAQQATKSKMLWRTTDHSKHEILQKDFKSGAELTQACISCHSEAEKQFHKTIHWTWLADPEDSQRQYGKAGNSFNNYCISTNKTNDAGCLSCHPGWGNSKESPVNCLVWDEQYAWSFSQFNSCLHFFTEDDHSTALA